MLDSLLVFNVAGLGEKFTLIRRLVGLERAFEEEMQIRRDAFPHATIDWHLTALRRVFDAFLMCEALAGGERRGGLRAAMVVLCLLPVLAADA